MKRKKKQLPKAITQEEFKKLVSKIPTTEKEIKIAFLIAYESGLRISEVVNLKKENLRDDVKPNFIEVIGGKGGVDRQVPFPKTWRKDMRPKIPLTKSVRSLQRAFRKYSAKAGLNPRYTFHSLRHGFATRLVERGVPPNHIQALLGHADISTTGVYMRARPVDALNSYEEYF